MLLTCTRCGKSIDSKQFSEIGKTERNGKKYTLRRKICKTCYGKNVDYYDSFKVWQNKKNNV